MAGHGSSVGSVDVTNATPDTCLLLRNYFKVSVSLRLIGALHL